jgi:hypothetical protein
MLQSVFPDFNTGDSEISLEKKCGVYKIILRK